MQSYKKKKKVVGNNIMELATIDLGLGNVKKH
jgi:hypothetical protein